MDHQNDLPPVKLKVHRSFTSKQLSSQLAKRGPKNFSEPSRVVRIYYTDSDATDSSSDNDEQNINRQKIKKRYISEIKIRTSAEKSPKKPNEVVVKQKPEIPTRKNVKKTVTPNCPKYRGVWKRQSGKWAAEIRDSFDGRKIWLGVHDTAEEASYVYENTAIQFKEAKALKENNLKLSAPNHMSEPADAVTVEMAMGCPVGCSTSVFVNDYKPAEGVALEDGMWATDDSESCYMSKSIPLVFEEMVDDRRCLDDEESVSFDFAKDINFCSWNVEDFFDNHVKMV